MLDAVPSRTDPDEIIHCGCEELTKIVAELPMLKCHIFGHIHEGYGSTCVNGVEHINASICTEAYMPTNKPIVFELN